MVLSRWTLAELVLTYIEDMKDHFLGVTTVTNIAHLFGMEKWRARRILNRLTDQGLVVKRKIMKEEEEWIWTTGYIYHAAGKAIPIVEEDYPRRHYKRPVR